MFPRLRALPSAIRASVLSAAALAAILAPLAPVAAAAAAADDDPVRWSIAPADSDGADGRRAVEHELGPGERVDEHFAVRNLGEQEITFRITAADGFFTQTGRFDILADAAASTAAGAWITAPAAVTVPAGESVVVPFSLAVPERAEPGDYAAGVTASILSAGSAEGGASVGVESRIGFRVLTRVTGEITPAASLDALVGDYRLSWNPLRPGGAQVSFDVVNDGNTRLAAAGTVSVGGRTVSFPAEGQQAQELLPGDRREITVVVDEVWPWVLLTTTVTLTPEVLAISDTDATIAPISADVAIWAVPWPQLAILLGAGLVVWAILWRRSRSQRRISAMIDDALQRGREEGRNEMTDQVGAS
ncbi:DUF916 domain-containing protein [Microbacterium neimengense]